MIQRDYILRMLEQATKVIIRLLKLKDEEQYEAALQTLSDGIDELFGIDGNMLRRVDAETAAYLLGQWQKVKTFARLTREEAGIFEALGREGQAIQLQRRAAVLYLEALRLKGSSDEESLQVLREIIALQGRTFFTGAQRQLLHRFQL